MMDRVRLGNHDAGKTGKSVQTSNLGNPAFRAGVSNNTLFSEYVVMGKIPLQVSRFLDRLTQLMRSGETIRREALIELRGGFEHGVCLVRRGIIEVLRDECLEPSFIRGLYEETGNPNIEMPGWQGMRVWKLTKSGKERLFSEIEKKVSKRCCSEVPFKLSRDEKEAIECRYFDALTSDYSVYLSKEGSGAIFSDEDAAIINQKNIPKIKRSLELELSWLGNIDDLQSIANFTLAKIDI